ncbi:hypothetical protein LIER_06505 [Lithospermum erythrorhizon]|uniref:Uncharacterized protein n=1 Tax=Lithospermum erythrorhizon TaxID=34254 RepID=A0AAV3P7B2_LITER
MRFKYELSDDLSGDEGAGCIIMKSEILPAAYWKNCSMEFRTTNGQSFTVSLISKPTYLQLFPRYTIKARVYGSNLPRKDILLGFDILHSLKRISWHPKGLKHKNHLLP